MFTALLTFLGGSAFRMLQRTATLCCAFGLKVSGFSLLGGIKKAKVPAYPIVSFALSRVFTRIGVEPDTKFAHGIVAMCLSKVLQVCFVVNATQVVKRVVLFVTVYVIHTFRGPLTRHVKNGASVGIVFLSINRKFYVPMRLKPASHVSGFGCAAAFFSSKYTRMRVVSKHLFDAAWRKIGSSHVDSLTVGVVRSLSRLRIMTGFAILTGSKNV
jgi:uncharacterized membrane protein